MKNNTWVLSLLICAWYVQTLQSSGRKLVSETPSLIQAIDGDQYDDQYMQRIKEEITNLKNRGLTIDSAREPHDGGTALEVILQFGNSSGKRIEALHLLLDEGANPLLLIDGIPVFLRAMDIRPVFSEELNKQSNQLWKELLNRHKFFVHIVFCLDKNIAALKRIEKNVTLAQYWCYQMERLQYNCELEKNIRLYSQLRILLTDQLRTLVAMGVPLSDFESCTTRSATVNRLHKSIIAEVRAELESNKIP